MLKIIDIGIFQKDGAYISLDHLLQTIKGQFMTFVCPKRLVTKIEIIGIK